MLEWIHERRMAKARRLLVETDESIERIGANVGYEDPIYFIRRFRTDPRLLAESQPLNPLEGLVPARKASESLSGTAPIAASGYVAAAFV